MEKTQKMMYHDSSSEYEAIGKKLYQIEEKIDRYSDYYFFVINLLHKCETYYKENKESKTPYMNGVYFIDYQLLISYNELPLLFKIKIWNFKTKNYISYENSRYFSVPIISIKDDITEISIDLPLISGHHPLESIEYIGSILTKIPYQLTLNKYNEILSLKEKLTFDALLKEFRNTYSRKSVIEITEKNDRQILDFILLKDEKIQDVLISMWFYAMNECASIYQKTIIEKEKQEAFDNVLFEFNVLNNIGGGINKHGIEIVNDMFN